MWLKSQIVKNSNLALLLAISAAIASILIDTSIVKVYSFISKPYNPISDILIYIILVVISLTTQFVILKSIKIKRKEITMYKNFDINMMYRAISITQYSLSVPLSIAVVQMLLLSSYSSSILFTVTSISYIPAIFVLGLLAFRFFSWFRSNPSYIVLAYGIAVGSISMNIAITFFYISAILLSQPSLILQHVGQVYTFGAYGSPLYAAYYISSVISFIAIWIATVVILRHYSRKMGSIKYWIIVSIPLVYFLGQFQPLFLSIFSWYRQYDPITFGIVYTLFFTISKVVGGILFGIAFLMMARSIRQNNIVRSYLMISGYGIMLILASNQAIAVVNYPYPPFGLVTVSFLGLSAYILFIGIYSSAVSIAHDVELRRSIRRFAVKESTELLDSIGTAHMGQEIEKKVIAIASKNEDKLLENTGVQSSLEEEDIKTYLNEVLEELKNTEKK